mmetsp:Transcript_16714/g.25765  ORF Transcript_16714/g.25765 Transcript_16714/m.25765 type:complete len:255 (-) Transcript_16714:314-1078(-)
METVFADLLSLHVLLKDRFSGHHTRLHGVMSSLDFGHIEEASRAASEHTSGEVQLRDCVVTAFVKDSCSVRDTLTAFEDLGQLGMGLQALELLIRVEIRVLVVQTDDESEVNEIGLGVIHETSGVHILAQRPADSMLDEPRLEMRVVIGNLPHLLQPDSVVLDARRFVGQSELVLELLREGSSGTFSENGLFSKDINSRFERVLHLTIFVDTHISRPDTDHGLAGLVVEDTVSRDSFKNVNSELSGLLTEPLGK